MPGPEPTNRRRILFVFAAISVLGLSAGAVANQGVARLLALPEGEDAPAYADADAPREDGAAEGDAPDAVADAGELADDAEPPRRSSKAKTRAKSKKQYADIIVRRNIFDSSAVYDPDAASAAGGDGACTNDTNIRLLATVVADLPEYSSALIAMGSAKDAKTDGYSIGDELGSSGRITAIDPKKVCVDGGSCFCIGGDEKPAATAAASKDGEEAGGVEKTGDNKYQVDQSVLDDALNNFEKLAGQLRAVPHKDASGNVDGFRLSAIRKGSVFDKLGIKNGDVVHAVNGTALTSTEGALSTYQTLKNERTFTFDITRRNQRQSMEYEVR